MAKNLPFFRWFPTDAETDEWYRHLSLAELGYYHRILNYAWINGSIPADPKERCSLFRIHYKTEEKVFRSISSKLIEGGIEGSLSQRLVPIHLQQEFNTLLMKSASASESAKRRYERTARASDYDSISESKEVKPQEKREISIARARENPKISADDFESAWDRHLKHTRSEPKDLVLQQILSMNGKFDEARFRERHAVFCDAWDKAGWQYCPLTFLGWIEAGMPMPPPKPDSQKTRAERIAERE